MDNISLLQCLIDGVNPYTGAIISKADFLCASDVIGRFEAIQRQLKRSKKTEIIYGLDNFVFLETIAEGRNPVTNKRFSENDPLKVDYIVERLKEYIKELRTDYEIINNPEVLEYDLNEIARDFCKSLSGGSSSNTVKTNELAEPEPILPNVPENFDNNNIQCGRNKSKDSKGKKRKTKFKAPPVWMKPKSERKQRDIKKILKVIGKVVLFAMIVGALATGIFFLSQKIRGCATNSSIANYEIITFHSVKSY